MKAFLLMSAAWLSGAGGDHVAAPTATPVPTLAPAPVVASAPTGPCCGSAAPVAGVPYYGGGIQSTVVSGGCCDPCANPCGGAATPAAPAAGAAPAGKAGHGFLHGLFGKKGGAAAGGAAATGGHHHGLFGKLFGGKAAPVATAPAAAATTSGCGCATSTPACGCSSGAWPTGVPATAVIPGHTHLPHSATPYPTVIGTPGTVVAPGTIVAPGTGGQPLPTGGQPLPMGTTPPPEGVKEAPKEPAKLPGTPPSTVLPTVPSFQPAAGIRVESEGRNPFDYHHRQQAQLVCAADYSSMTGRLSYVHADGGLWVLRYAPLDKEDLHGGSVVLLQDRRLDSYREGDLVQVKGEILAAKASTRLAAPLYRFNAIQLVERPAN